MLTQKLSRLQGALATLFSGASGGGFPASLKKRVLLLGIDGVQYEKLLAQPTPHFDQLFITRAYTGGVTGTPTEQMTSSGPGWATILTGVWASKHLITDNDADLANPAFPSLFKRLRDARPQARIASVMNWGTPNTRYFRQDVASNNTTFSGLSDQEVISVGVDLIHQDYDLIFLQLDDPDQCGHSHGFGPAYNHSLVNADRHLGQLLEAVRKRREDWLVLVTTDHGRTPVTGCHHGYQSVSEKTVFIASNKPLCPAAREETENTGNPHLSGLYQYPPQTSIAPTVCQHLGLPTEPGWNLDGVPLNAEVDSAPEHT